MLNRVLFACLFAASAAMANAESYTAPVLNGIHECTPAHMGPNGVKLAFVITEKGTVEDIKVVATSGDPQADKLAMECVANWTYKPATRDGVPVAHKMLFNLHGGRPEDLEGNRKAFSSLERDATRRCNKLYPVKRSLLNLNQAITLVNVARLASGEIQTQVTQSAGEKADRQAVACVTALVKSEDHADLPPIFVRVIEVNWGLAR